MQSFYHHHHHPRKLLKVTAAPNIPKSCQSSCDPHKNTLGSCPVACIGLCGDVCKYPQPVISPITESSAPKVVHNGSSQYRHKSHHLSPYGIVFLSSVIAACLALTAYATYKLCKRQRRSSSLTERVDDEGEEQNPNQGDHEFMIGDGDEDGYWHVLDHPIWYIRTVGLLPSLIGSITVVDYKKCDGLIEGTGCSVCLTEFEEDERVKLLPKCCHAFHITCVDTWLMAHTNCPLCRAPVMNNNASQEITTPRQNMIEEVEDTVSSRNNEGVVVGIELENDDEGSESRTNHGFDNDRRDGLKIVHEHEEDCNSSTKSVANFDQCTVESL